MRHDANLRHNRYAHILTYLRSPESTSEAPAVLPHGARLNGSTSRLEALLELRDESAYLGLDELQKLCTDELRHRHPSPSGSSLGGLGLHMRGFSNASNKSLHTLRERAEPVESELVHAVTETAEEYGYESVMMDEGVLIGVEVRLRLVGRV